MKRIKRTPLAQRQLPNYSSGEETFNMVSHIVGGGLGVLILAAGIILSAVHHNPWAIAGCSVYGVSMIVLYTMSSVYHGLRIGLGKKVLQVIDHCTIYLLIAGTYTPILLASIRPQHPALAWTIFGLEWGLAALAATLTAIDLKKYTRVSMICYISMGWLIAIAIKPTIDVLGSRGFLWLLAGGISYTIGAVLYGIGKKRRYFHGIFHIFVLLGSMLQAVCILLYVA